MLVLFFQTSNEVVHIHDIQEEYVVHIHEEYDFIPM